MKPSFVVGGNAAESGEALLDRFFLRIIRVQVLAIRISLPDFDDAIGYRLAVAIQDSACDFHAFTGNARACQIVSIEPRETNLKEWANGLGCGRMKTHDFSPCACVSMGVLSRPLRTMSKR